MILTSADIRNSLSSTSYDAELQLLRPRGGWADAADHLLIHPFDKKRLTPVGYDLAVGKKYLSFEQALTIDLQPGQSFAIQPGETVLILTEEYIGLPTNRLVAGFIESKVRLVSKGLSHISTTLDPDWEGPILIAMSNHQKYPIDLKRGDALCTSVFMYCKSEPDVYSFHEPGRSDILLARQGEFLQRKKEQERVALAAEQEKASRPRWYKRWETGLIVLILFIVVINIIGWLAADHKDAFTGSATIGLTIATLILVYANFAPKRP